MQNIITIDETKNIVLYGAGIPGVFSALVLSINGITPTFFCDKVNKGVELITGIPIIDPQTLKNDYSNAQIIITAFEPSIADEIYDDLSNLGFDTRTITHFFSMDNIPKHNVSLINNVLRYGYNTNSNFKVVSSILKDELEIIDGFIKFKNFMLPYTPREATNLFGIILDTFLPCLVSFPYTRKYVDVCDMISPEGSYLLNEIDCPMTIGEDDVVIDAGAWYGDFSILSAINFGAVTYAFEPSISSYEVLLRTITLNKCEGRIIPIKAGLGSKPAKAKLLNCSSTSARISEEGNEDMVLVTIDDFVAEQSLTHVDFIKADIEGFEREMLKGATKTLREFAPKLSLCTYHLRDDSVVLRKLISNANPAYRFEQRKKKLFAWVDK